MGVIVEKGVEVVIVSLGEYGVICTTEERVLRVIPPKVEVANTVGAGDALVGGFIFALHREEELEEALRVADSRISQMEALLENERVRRADIEVGGERGRLVELQDENARLLRSEEEHVMLILDMEAQLERLVDEVENLRRGSSQ
jgi:fructose-1-phosphate kinase PfkB-like protein